MAATKEQKKQKESTEPAQVSKLDIGQILRWGSLIIGLCLLVSGVFAVQTATNAETFLLSQFTFSLSTCLFGILIAQTIKPIGAIAKWFPFVIPFVGRGIFMIYVGFGSFSENTFSEGFEIGDVEFETIVGFFSVVFGILHIVLSLCGMVNEGKTHNKVPVIKHANSNQV